MAQRFEPRDFIATPKIDETGETLKMTDDGLLKVDGIATIRKVIRDGIVYVQFCDHDRMRASCRGTKFVEIPLDVLVKSLT